jgi:ABC-2 type transport system permease protein
MSQFSTGVRTHTTSFVRKPLNLVLLVVLPPVVIVLYGEAMEAFSALPLLSSLGVDLGTVGRLTGALFATAFLTGIIGLFQVISARQGDERLVLCGFSRSTLLATRLVTVIGAAVLAAGVSLIVLWLTVSVSAPLVAFGALLLGGVCYGLLGMLVGALLARELEGSLVLVFLVDIDDALSSGMFIESSATIPKLFPLYRPHELLETAVIDGTVATDSALGGGVYLAVLAVLVFSVYVRVIGTRGGAA